LNEADLHKELGEIKGLLEGVYRLVQNQHEATNQRITDLHVAVTRRLDLHEADIESIRATANGAMTTAATAQTKADDLQAASRKQAVVSGSGAGLVVAAGIELIKVALKAG